MPDAAHRLRVAAFGIAFAAFLLIVDRMMAGAAACWTGEIC
jgi:hypothetical protein